MDFHSVNKLLYFYCYFCRLLLGQGHESWRVVDVIVYLFPLVHDDLRMYWRLSKYREIRGGTLYFFLYNGVFIKVLRGFGSHIQYLRTKGKSQTLNKNCTSYYPLAFVTLYCLLMPCGLVNEFHLA